MLKSKAKVPTSQVATARCGEDRQVRRATRPGETPLLHLHRDWCFSEWPVG